MCLSPSQNTVDDWLLWGHPQNWSPHPSLRLGRRDRRKVSGTFMTLMMIFDGDSPWFTVLLWDSQWCDVLSVYGGGCDCTWEFEIRGPDCNSRSQACQKSMWVCTWSDGLDFTEFHWWILICCQKSTQVCPTFLQIAGKNDATAISIQ